MYNPKGGEIMIQITDKAKMELCEKLSINLQRLTYLGGGREDSDGTVYTYHEGTRKKVLKILAIQEAEKEKLKNLQVRIKYAHYLGANGIKLAYPLYNKNGNLYEVSLDNKYYYTAYVMDFYEGGNPQSSELTDELVYNWGKLTGKSHAITKTFREDQGNDHFSYEQEVDFFENWCKEPEIKHAWIEMKQYLSKLPTGLDDYGFIHNDNHQRNILVNNNEITLIDFDCAGRQFFIQDIITPAQGIMFDIVGGMLSPLNNENRLKHFFDCFINGYETEHHLGDRWYQEISIFLNYRRMLLFTCMQDWLNTEPELKKHFMKNILNPPSFEL